MAAKKSSKKSTPKSSGQAGSKPGPPSPLGFLQDLVDSIPDEIKTELLRSLMGGIDSQPSRARSGNRNVRKAEELLSQVHYQETPGDALPLLREASELARKAIGKRWDKYMGGLGQIDEGDLYLEVQCELAAALRATGQADEAIRTGQEAMELDAADPGGVRFPLLGAYLDSDRLDDAERLLDEECDEPFAAWIYSRLLLALRRGKRGEAVEQLLLDAHGANAHVLARLLAYDLVEAFENDPLASEEAEDAQSYVIDYLASWRETPGALSWLREATSRLKLELPKENQGEPQRLSARDYAAMQPHEHATWIVGTHELPNVKMPGASERQTVCLVFGFSPDGDLVGFDARERQPKPRELWDAITDFMQQADSPGRPEHLQVHPHELVEKLKKYAAKARIELEPCTDLGEIPFLLDQLAARLQGGTAAAEQLPPDAIIETPLNVDEVFEAAVIQLEQRLNLPDESLRPWIALVIARSSGLILWNELFMDAPPAQALENAVRMAIARPALAEACRPREVVVRDHDEALALQALSDEAGFLCTVGGELPLIQQALGRLTDEFLGTEKGSVLSRVEDLEKADLEAFYTTAADFYRARPWRHFSMNELIALDWHRSDSASADRWLGLVMGQSGITQGIAVYHHREDVEAMFSGGKEGETVDSMSVMFGEEASIAPPDLDTIEQFGWPVATPEAYPEALRVLPGMKVQTPAAEELRFLTAALGVITRLIQDRDATTVTSVAGGAVVRASRHGFA